MSTVKKIVYGKQKHKNNTTDLQTIKGDETN